MSFTDRVRDEAERQHAEAERSLNAAKHAEGSDYHRNDGHRDGFQDGAVWGRDDALRPPTDAEIEAAAKAVYEHGAREAGTEETWNLATPSEREWYRGYARAALATFLNARRAE